MKYCSRCGRPAEDDARFCEACGHPFNLQPGDSDPGPGSPVGHVMQYLQGQGDQVGREAFGSPPHGPPSPNTHKAGDSQEDVMKVAMAANRPAKTSRWGLLKMIPVLAVAAGAVAAFVSGMFLAVLPPAVKPIAKPLVCPSKAKDFLVVAHVHGPWNHRKVYYEYYCVDSNGAPRYVSTGKVFVAIFLLLMGGTVLAAAVAFLAVKAGNRAGGGRKLSVVLLLAGLSALLGACTAGTISPDTLKERFKGYLWTEGGQRAFQEHVIEELGSKASKLYRIEFGYDGTRADFAVGPDTPGRAYYYSLGRLWRTGRAWAHRETPCMFDLRTLDPKWIPRVVAKANEDGAVTVDGVSVVGRSSNGRRTCDSLTFRVTGRSAVDSSWKHTYGQDEL